jgi:hypothetical protein
MLGLSCFLICDWNHGVLCPTAQALGALKEEGIEPNSLLSGVVDLHPPNLNT